MEVTFDTDPEFTHDDVGTAETEWEAALARHCPRSTGEVVADLLRPGGRLVVVAPHPDDETLGAGGLIAMAAASGMSITIVSCTDGEAAYPVDGLGPLRRKELERSVRRLAGSRDVRIVSLGLPDGSLRQCVGSLASSIERASAGAELVVGPWRSDGHPDHDAVGISCEQVCSAEGSALYSYPIWAWHWGGPELFDDRELSQLPLSPAARRAKAFAIRAFESQTVGMGAGPILTSEVLAHFDRPTETFVRSEW